MAKRRISYKRKKHNRKSNIEVIPTTHVPLCAMGEVIKGKALFSPIHQLVTIPQKSIEYTPTDKLVFAALSIAAGGETVYDANTTVRPNKPLLIAFGYEKCADQSVIQQTINCATEENVNQLEEAIKKIFKENNQIVLSLDENHKEQELVTIDIDLSPLPASKASEGSKKGYVAKKKNQYTRQLARVLVPSTSEIVSQSLYFGNTVSCSVLKEMVYKMENQLEVETKEKRQHLRLRLDAGFGTDENINFSLWRGYNILAKVYSQKRAKALTKSVKEWVVVPSLADNTQREAGFVQSPHRYCRKTVQVAVRTPTKKGGYSYSALVTTSINATLEQIVTDYDKRGGVPESTFCQDYQGLHVRRRRKGGFTAQKVLVLLSQLAHNLIIWMKSWLSDSLEASLFTGEEEPTKTERKSIALAQNTIQQRGIKRFIRQILALSGKVVFNQQRVVCIFLNPLYPLINRIKTAFEAFLKPYNITVLLDEN
jgi:hypothetical protein